MLIKYFLHHKQNILHQRNMFFVCCCTYFFVRILCCVCCCIIFWGFYFRKIRFIECKCMHVKIYCTYQSFCCINLLKRKDNKKSLETEKKKQEDTQINSGRENRVK